MNFPHGPNGVPRNGKIHLCKLIIIRYVAVADENESFELGRVFVPQLCGLTVKRARTVRGKKHGED